MQKKQYLRSRIQSVLGYGFLIALFTGVISFSGLTLREFDRQKIRLQSLIQLYSDDSIAIELGRKNIVYVEDSLARLRKSLSSETISIVDRTGVTLASDQTDRANSHWNPSFSIAVPVKEHSSRVVLGTLVVRLTYLRVLTPIIIDALVLSLFCTAAMLLLIIVIAGRLNREIISPIVSLSEKGATASDFESWPIEFQQLAIALRSQQKEREQALIGQFTGGIIHDFKTLLQPIVGATQLSKISTDTERKNKNLDRLLQACDRNLPRMQNMLEAVLDGNRDIRLQLRDDDLNETVLNAIRNAQEASDPAKTVSIRTNLPSIPVRIQHDRSQLERALTNLVKNGIEASAANSQSRSLQITLADDTETATVSVEDSGKGFVQPLKTLIEARSTTKLRGTGLGLFVSDKIISAHRGVLSSENAGVLGGAKIVVTLSKGASA